MKKAVVLLLIVCISAISLFPQDDTEYSEGAMEGEFRGQNSQSNRMWLVIGGASGLILNAPGCLTATIIADHVSPSVPENIMDKSIDYRSGYMEKYSQVYRDRNSDAAFWSGVAGVLLSSAILGYIAKVKELF